MNTNTIGLPAALTFVTLSVVSEAAETQTRDANQTWALFTADTELALALAGNVINIVSLRTWSRNGTGFLRRPPSPCLSSTPGRR